MKQTSQSISKKSASILIADDDRLILVTMKSGLVGAGFEVEIVENGKDALHYCSQNEPDLVILDIEMPGVSGLNVAEYLTQHTSIPFVIFTAYDTDDYVDTAIALGAIGFLVKPLAINQLVPEIKVLLERAAESKKLHQSETGLKVSLQNSKLINLAVGVIMERYRLTAQDAFEQIRKMARSERKKLVDVATEISEAKSTLHKFKPKD
jgi:AmiR/NasT family two-component response regulator